MTLQTSSRSQLEATLVKFISRTVSRQPLGTQSNSVSYLKTIRSLSQLLRSRVSEWRVGLILGSCQTLTIPRAHPRRSSSRSRTKNQNVIQPQISGKFMVYFAKHLCRVLLQTKGSLRNGHDLQHQSYGQLIPG